MKTMLVFSLFLIASGFAMAQQDQAPRPIAPYSPFVKAGNTYYIAGQIPIDPETGELVRDDIRKATRVVMENIGRILKQNGLDYSNIVKCTVYLKNLDHYQAMNEVYGSFFAGRYPARVAVQVARLPLDADIEIASIAVKE
jgi:2-iminobutanoate/2-iminopropanoate deaminase